MTTPPTTECFCGADIRRQPLPADLAKLAGRDYLYVHVETGDDRCYPDSSDPNDAKIKAGPALAKNAGGYIL